jgi:hypothetical protein
VHRNGFSQKRPKLGPSVKKFLDYHDGSQAARPLKKNGSVGSPGVAAIVEA